MSSDLYLNPDNYELCSFINSDTLDNFKYVYEDIDPDENFINSQKSETIHQFSLNTSLGKPMDFPFFMQTEEA